MALGRLLIKWQHTSRLCGTRRTRFSVVILRSTLTVYLCVCVCVCVGAFAGYARVHAIGVCLCASAITMAVLVERPDRRNKTRKWPCRRVCLHAESGAYSVLWATRTLSRCERFPIAMVTALDLTLVKSPTTPPPPILLGLQCTSFRC